MGLRDKIRPSSQAYPVLLACSLWPWTERTLRGRSDYWLMISKSFRPVSACRDDWAAAASSVTQIKASLHPDTFFLRNKPTDRKQSDGDTKAESEALMQKQQGAKRLFVASPCGRSLTRRQLSRETGMMSAGCQLAQTPGRFSSSWLRAGLQDEEEEEEWRLPAGAGNTRQRKNGCVWRALGCVWF